MKALYLYLFACFITCSLYINGLKQLQKVYLYSSSNNVHLEAVINSLNRFNVSFEQVSQISSQDAFLYIIFDIDQLKLSELPQHYIVYQTRDLSHSNLHASYLSKLSNAIAIWDYSRNNIDRYNKHVHHYQYLPKNYEYIDPVILPCFLPVKALKAYKEILIYDNQSNTDISSHLPTLFCYCVMQAPELMLELGVRGGESTKALTKSLSFGNSTLLGIDIQSYSEQSYTACPNATFLCMNDLDFPNYLSNSKYKNSNIDLVFIDTSHLYEHTLAEIQTYVPLLSKKGMLLFHDSNVTPINGHQYYRLNGTIGGGGYGNTRGVTQAIKEYFALEFNEHEYVNRNFTAHSLEWNITHYPFCNGLTAITKLN